MHDFKNKQIPSFHSKLDQRNENKYSATAAIYRQGMEKKEIRKLKNESYWEIKIICFLLRQLVISK